MAEPYSILRHWSKEDLDVWRNNCWANVMVTTACDRDCPDCCEGDVVLRAKGRIFSPESIAADVAALGEVGMVTLTGGEPTLHPKFDEVARLCRAARGNRQLRLISNGAKLEKHAASLKYFDRVDMSIFTAESNAGAPTDPTIVDRVRAAKPQTEFKPYVVIHSKSSGRGACGREKYSVSTMEGRVYGCCVANGIAGAESTDLSPGWEDRLGAVPLPCDRCVFGR